MPQRWIETPVPSNPAAFLAVLNASSISLYGLPLGFDRTNGPRRMVKSA